MMDMELNFGSLMMCVRTFVRLLKCLSIDNCKTQVNLPVWHVYTKNDHYFDHRIVEATYDA